MSFYSFLVFYFAFSGYYIFVNIILGNELVKVIYKGLFVGILGIGIYLLGKKLVKFILVKKARKKLERLEDKEIKILNKAVSAFFIGSVIYGIDIVSRSSRPFLEVFYELYSLILMTVAFTFISLKMESGSFFQDKKVSYSRKINIKTDFESAFKTSLQALNEIKRCRIEEKAENRGVIKAEVDLNIKTFGEKIEIKINQAGDKMVEINIKSECKEENFEDYYKNYSNVQEIIDYLKNNI